MTASNRMIVGSTVALLCAIVGYYLGAAQVLHRVSKRSEDLLQKEDELRGRVESQLLLQVHYTQAVLNQGLLNLLSEGKLIEATCQVQASQDANLLALKGIVDSYPQLSSGGITNMLRLIAQRRAVSNLDCPQASTNVQQQVSAFLSSFIK